MAAIYRARHEHMAISVKAINCGIEYTRNGKLTEVQTGTFPYIRVDDGVDNDRIPFVGLYSAIKSISASPSNAKLFTNEAIRNDHGAPWLCTNHAFERYFERSFGRKVTDDVKDALLRVETEDNTCTDDA